ncbi:hypothetical protein K9857_07400 [Pseudomonas sp. REP124]|uniref:hypothetical protein n=1 Tax=Pseudomonas sp. REP124 TaxID=2875731 RepID=UPI001CCF54AE|nr:hypothetical protein [Pseudomonas sp. REP124]MBZ9781378.1 hypothetical protein [Pseudomonas sp. REP124]
MDEQRWIDLSFVQDHEHQLMLELAVPLGKYRRDVVRLMLNFSTPFAGQPTSPVLMEC